MRTAIDIDTQLFGKHLAGDLNTGFVVVDLGSTNGTRINGIRIAEQELVDGDEVTFGNTRMRFEAS